MVSEKVVSDINALHFESLCRFCSSVMCTTILLAEIIIRHYQTLLENSRHRDFEMTVSNEWKPISTFFCHRKHSTLVETSIKIPRTLFAVTFDVKSLLFARVHVIPSHILLHFPWPIFQKSESKRRRQAVSCARSTLITCRRHGQSGLKYASGYRIWCKLGQISTSSRFFRFPIVFRCILRDGFTAALSLCNAYQILVNLLFHQMVLMLWHILKRERGNTDNYTILQIINGPLFNCTAK